MIRETGAAYAVPSLTRVTRSGQVTLPSSLRRLLGIQEGDLVEAAIEGERIVLTPKRLVDKSQAWFWSKSWQEAEAEAEADIKAGRVKRFDSAHALLRDLDA